MKFRPCIDLHEGVVKQIVGSSLSDTAPSSLKTNFQAANPPSWFAALYKKDHLTGGHIIQLGPGNTAAARSALAEWPGGMQLGGGVNIDNAAEWLDAGAQAVIVTSYAFYDGVFDEERTRNLAKKIGKDRLVLDLSCRKKDGDYYIVTNRWQTFTRETLSFEFLDRLKAYCFEFLIHAVDVEGKSGGIERDLVRHLGKWAGIPITYAGGIRSMEDIEIIRNFGNSHIDFTVGSALDIFGGNGLAYETLARQFGKS